MSDYRTGLGDGLREAVGIVQAMLADVERRLAAEGQSRATRLARTVRAQAYRNAATRITTRLKKVERPRSDAFQANIKRLGL